MGAAYQSTLEMLILEVRKHGVYKADKPWLGMERQDPGGSIPVCLSKRMVGQVNYNGFSENRGPKTQAPIGRCKLFVRCVALRTDELASSIQIISMGAS